ncbi:MAG: BON domain-containing protein [Oligoflexia bacterium]|nr:BON domain-containing protein [Oligoflexia bacterium]
MTFILLCTLLVTLVGCGSTSTSESTGQYVDDSVITAKIKANLAEDKIVHYFQISVETYKGVVQLSGFVNTKEQVERAGEITSKVAGVIKVKNNLIIKPK